MQVAVSLFAVYLLFAAFVHVTFWGYFKAKKEFVIWLHERMQGNGEGS